MSSLENLNARIGDWIDEEERARAQLLFAVKRLCDRMVRHAGRGDLVALAAGADLISHLVEQAVQAETNALALQGALEVTKE